MPLKFKPFKSPYSWSFIDPDLNREFSAPSKAQLISELNAARAQNDLAPIESIDIVIDNYLCGKPENRGICEGFDLPRSFGQELKGGIALFKNLRYNKIVEKEVADSRANVCLKCPHNGKYDKTRSVEIEDWLFDAHVGKPRVPEHKDLYTCEICTCPLKSKVWYGEKISNSDDIESRLPSFCWQKRKNLTDE